MRALLLAPCLCCPVGFGWAGRCLQMQAIQAGCIEQCPGPALSILQSTQHAKPPTRLCLRLAAHTLVRCGTAAAATDAHHTPGISGTLRCMMVTLVMHCPQPAVAAVLWQQPGSQAAAASTAAVYSILNAASNALTTACSWHVSVCQLHAGRSLHCCSTCTLNLDLCQQVQPRATTWPGKRGRCAQVSRQAPLPPL